MADSRAFFHRQAVRRARGLPTVDVLVGPAGIARRLWIQNSGSRQAIECHAEPWTPLREFLTQHRAAFEAAALRHWAARGNREPEQFCRDWASKTDADRNAFWNTLGPEPGDEFLRQIFRPGPLPEIRSLVRLNLPGFAWPVLFAVPTAHGSLLEWGAFAGAEPQLNVTLAVSPPLWDAFRSTAGSTRPEALLIEGEHILPLLSKDAIRQTLTAGGMPENTASEFADVPSDADSVEATLQTYHDTAAPPVSPNEDDQARSEAERRLFELLENLPDTAGRFRLNATMDFKFRSKAAEIDLACGDPRIAIEVDGYYHFRDDDGYRRDREKDWVLQKHGFLVLRFLASDVTRHWDVIRDRILEALKRSRP